MNASEQTGELVKALATAQAEMTNATLNKTAGDEKKFTYKYADMAAVRDAIVPALTKNGIAVTQATDWNADGFSLVTRLSHESGQWIQSVYPLRMLDNPQHTGALLTYARRYSLSSMCAIAVEEDFDAEDLPKKVRDIGPARSPKTRKDGNQKSAHKAHKEGDWDAVMEFQSITNLDQLDEWWQANRERVQAMPANWQDHFYPLYEDHRASLKGQNILEAG